MAQTYMSFYMYIAMLKHTCSIECFICDGLECLFLDKKLRIVIRRNQPTKPNSQDNS